MYYLMQIALMRRDLNLSAREEREIDDKIKHEGLFQTYNYLKALWSEDLHQARAEELAAA